MREGGEGKQWGEVGWGWDKEEGAEERVERGGWEGSRMRPAWEGVGWVLPCSPLA